MLHIFGMALVIPLVSQFNARNSHDVMKQRQLSAVSLGMKTVSKGIQVM